MKDLTGQMFGDLEALDCVGSDKGSALWRMKCHRCGGECIKSAKHLNYNDPLMPKDCGCQNRERAADLVGRKFGSLKVLRRDGTYPNGSSAYICLCELCGSVKTYSASNLKKGQRSCGCAKADSKRMKELSTRGVSRSVVDGVHIGNVFKQEPTKASKTGVRGVYLVQKTHLYMASCKVHGELWQQAGFSSIEAAKKAREKAQAELLQKYNVKNPKEDSNEENH